MSYSSDDNFYFGNGFMLPTWTASWNPDSREAQNGHLLIIGSSGSGKTRMLKHIVNYLDRRNKQVYVIDFHGDIVTQNETLHKFTSRNSNLGLSPFEFEKDVANGGVAVQVGVIVAIFKKNYIPNLGAIQKSTLKQLLIDSYKLAGIYDDDESSWDKELPTMTTLYELFAEIQKRIDYTSGSEFSTLFSKADAAKNEMDNLDENDDEAKTKLNNKLDKYINEINSKHDRYIKFLLENTHKNEFNTAKYKDIDLSFYFGKQIQKSLQTLGPYLKELCESPIFNENKPHSAKGVVRYDISGFTSVDKPMEAMFFADIMIQRIFRAVKLKGEYRTNSNSYKQRYGEKTSTFIVIDESKLILPTGKEKENPYNILNRVVTESRKFGLGLIIVSQRPSHFPEEILSNIYEKIVLKVNENDIPSAIKSLGVKDKALFTQLAVDSTSDSKKYICLCGTIGADFKSVVLPYES